MPFEYQPAILRAAHRLAGCAASRKIEKNSAARQRFGEAGGGV